MPNPLDPFQRVYIINLAARTDRRREMNAQLERIGLSIDSPGIVLFEAVRPEAREGFPSIGSRGCFMSHLGILKRALAERIDSILILEDDLDFCDGFEQRMGPVADMLRKTDWSMFYGGYRVDRPLPPAETGCATWPSENGVQTTHFVGVRGPAIVALVGYLEAQLARPPGDARGGPMHVDGSYTWFRREHPEYQTLIAVPELGHQRASRTDIHDLRLRDRLWGLRSLVALARRVRNARRGARGTAAG